MTDTAAPTLSVLIATRNRRHGLQSVLRDLDQAIAASGAVVEILVIDNGSTDSTAEFLETWSGSAELRHHLFVQQPGRSRALNAGIAIARSAVLAFTDDDVIVPQSWIAATLTFFAEYPDFAAGMGRVLLPPAVVDPDVIRRAHLYRGTLPLYDAGDTVRDVDLMYGCAMSVRRSALTAVGTFDERLGVGASGLCEDIDLSQRLRRKQLRIGYNPGAVIYHTVDTTRLSPAAYRDFQLRDAHSRYLMDPPRHWLKPLVRYTEASLARLTWSLLRNEEKRLWAWGRSIRHREMIRLCRQGA